MDDFGIDTFARLEDRLAVGMEVVLIDFPNGVLNDGKCGFSTHG
jgi:hypothetical protein